MQLNISTVGSTEIGQNLNITCTMRVVERLVVIPTIEIMKMNATDTYLLQDINIPFTVTTDDTGSETNWTIILESVRFEDRGAYICKADFIVTGVNGTDDPATATYDAQSREQDYELIVDCKLHIYNHTYINYLLLFSSSSCNFNYLSKSSWSTLCWYIFLSQMCDYIE